MINSALSRYRVKILKSAFILLVLFSFYLTWKFLETPILERYWKWKLDECSPVECGEILNYLVDSKEAQNFPLLIHDLENQLKRIFWWEVLKINGEYIIFKVDEEKLKKLSTKKNFESKWEDVTVNINQFVRCKKIYEQNPEIEIILRKYLTSKSRYKRTIAACLLFKDKESMNSSRALRSNLRALDCFNVVEEFPK